MHKYPATMSGRLVIVAAVALTYAAVLFNGFVTWDDNLTILYNPRLNPPTLTNTVYYWRHAEMELYIPLTYTVWSIVAAFARVHVNSAAVMPAWPFHLLNLSAHCISALIAFEVLDLLVRQRTAAAVGAILFAVHPLQVEAVAWASGLKDVMSGMLCLAAIWLLLRRAVETNAWNRDTLRATLLSLLAFAGALMAKPGAVGAIPVAFILLMQSPAKLTLWQSLKRLAPWCVFAAVSIAITSNVQRITPIPGDSLLARPLIAADAIAFYCWKFIWPFGLAPDYARRPLRVIEKGWILWTWIVPTVLTFCVIDNRKRLPLIVTASLVTLAGLAPMLGLVRFNFQRYSTVADHYTYLAMLGPAILAAALVACGGVSGLRVAAVLLFLLAVRSVHQVHYWHDSEQLFAHTVEISPDAPIAHMNYGVTLARTGRYPAAITQLEAAVKITPGNSMAQGNLALAHVTYGTSLATQGKLELAIVEFRTALHILPDYKLAQDNLAMALDQLRQRDRRPTTMR